MSVEIIPVEGLPEIEPGDDLAAMLGPRISALRLVEGDVVAVTQKIVSKAEGRVVPESEGRTAWVERETARVVARRADLVIARTRHGFVCANAGVDASNVVEGSLTLLPEDPDGSAARIREGLARATGIAPGVVITDTFGRAWRQGLVNVALGCAGMPALIDMRGTKDATGRVLESTVEAFADEVAAASGLVMGKADGVPAAIVRGLSPRAPAGRGADLIRPPEEDLFGESPLLSISARRTIRSFAPGEVSRAALEEAVRAACTAPAPHHTRPWLFVALESAASRKRLLAAMAGAWRRDLEGDGTAPEVIERRIAASNAVLGRAPTLIVPAVRLAGAHTYPDVERAGAERDMFVLSAGGGIQNLLLALHAQGLASCWISSTLFCREETSEALDLGEEWLPMGAVAAGRPPAGTRPPRPELDLGDHLLRL